MVVVLLVPIRYVPTYPIGDTVLKQLPVCETGLWHAGCPCTYPWKEAHLEVEGVLVTALPDEGPSLLKGMRVDHHNDLGSAVGS